MSGQVRHIWGWVLLVVGVVGLVMPIMPGWIFLIPGLVILSDYFAWARRLLAWAKQKAGYGEHSDRNETRRKGPGDQ